MVAHIQLGDNEPEAAGKQAEVVHESQWIAYASSLKGQLRQAALVTITKRVNGEIQRTLSYHWNPLEVMWEAMLVG
jgi:hypothetical protein